MNERNALNLEDRAVLDRIATGDSIHSQRARALLALDGGATQSTAAKESGLTISSVRYWRDRFMDQGLAIFPEGLINESEPAEAPQSEEKSGAKEKGKKKSKGGKKKSGKKSKKGTKKKKGKKNQK
jgi:transposase-like protein